MCEVSESELSELSQPPSEIIAFDSNNLIFYLNNKEVNKIEIKDINKSSYPSTKLIFPLPNGKFIISYENIEYKSMIAIVSYDLDILITQELEISNIPPVINGKFINDKEYIEIKDDNIVVTKLESDYRTSKMLPANNISKIEDLLVIDLYTPSIYKYKDIKNEYNILPNDNIIAWFDNRYVVSLHIEVMNSYIAIYDITKKYNKSKNILKLSEKCKDYNLPHVVRYFTNKQIGLNSTPALYPYVRTHKDDSIDIFLFDKSDNISILHITSKRKSSPKGDDGLPNNTSIIRRDIEVETYNYNQYNIKSSILSIMGDEFYIVIQTYNHNWYYINRYSKCE